VIAHLHPIAWECRLYDENGDKLVQEMFEDEDDWRGALLIRRFGDTAFVSMAQKKFDRHVFKQIRDYLFSVGVKDIQWKGSSRTYSLTERSR